MRRATCPSTAAQSAKPTATFERRGLPAQTFANHPRINANAWIPAFAGMTAKRREQPPGNGLLTWPGQQFHRIQQGCGLHRQWPAIALGQAAQAFQRLSAGQ